MRRSFPLFGHRPRTAVLAPAPATRRACAALVALLVTAHVATSRAGAQALPDAKTLMDKHNVAIGGRAMFDKLSSIRMAATMSIAAPEGIMEASMEVFRAKPNKYLQKVNIAAVGEISEGYDGKVAWALNPMAGAQLVEGEQLAAVKSNADFFAILQDASAYTNPRTIELGDFEGRKCYKVKVSRDGRDGFEYFDATTGLLAGHAGTQPGPQGPVEVTTVFVEYVDVEGIKLPKRIERRGGPTSATIIFTSFEFDKVAAAAFDLPAAVKALVKP